MKAWAFRIHRWLGALASLYIAFLAGTGTILSFRHELEPWLEPELFQISAGGERLPLETALRVVHQAFSDRSVRFVFPPRAPEDPLRMEITPRQEVFLDPYTGKLLGSRVLDSGFFGRVRSAHTGLLFGGAGKWLGLGAAASLLILAGTGLLVRRPFRLFPWGPAWKKPGRRLAVFHNWLGILFLPFLLIAATTGAYLLFSQPVSRFLSRLDPVLTAPRVNAPLRASPRESHLTLTDFSALAREKFPGSIVTRIAPPLKAGDPLVVRVRQSGEAHPNGLTFLYFDPGSPDPVAVRNPVSVTPISRLVYWQFPLHIGEYAGWLGPVIHPLGGAALLALSLSGLILFLRRFFLSPRRPAEVQRDERHPQISQLRSGS